MDKYALLIRMNPKYWPAWEHHIQAGKDSHVWFEVGRRIPEEIHAGLPVVVLGTSGMGILAIGETASAAEFRPDPDWADAAPSEQAEFKEPRNRVRIRMQGLAAPVPIEEIEANPVVARLPKVARDTFTWLKSDEYTVLMSLVRGENGLPGSGADGQKRRAIFKGRARPPHTSTLDRTGRTRVHTFPIHLTGFTTWNSDHNREAEFTAFILRSHQEFVFEVTFERIDYWGTLQRNSHGVFEGNFSAKDDHRTWGGRANCTLIELDSEYTLDGSWYEEGYTYAWHSDLEAK